MNIAISMEMTRKLRDTWHAALNHEWYDFLQGHNILPVCCHGKLPDLASIDLMILAGGNDMPDIRTWRDNNYPARDDFERRLIDLCISRDVAVMGVCRGFHFLNWIRGGTHRLMQDPYDGRTVHLDDFSVICHHTIEIDCLARGFNILQKDNHGVIELAIDHTHRLLGIGWHPERAVNIHTRQYVLDLIGSMVA